MRTKTMWVAIALVAVAWAPTASAGNCTNYGIHYEVNIGDKDCSYEGGNTYHQTCHTDSGAGAGAGAAAVGPGSGDPEAGAGATAGGNCNQSQSTNQTSNETTGQDRTYDGQLVADADTPSEFAVTDLYVPRTAPEA